jgi:hypothetical protein
VPLEAPGLRFDHLACLGCGALWFVHKGALCPCDNRTHLWGADKLLRKWRESALTAPARSAA